MYYIGIDPGKSGGLVCLNDQQIVSAVPMPKTERDIWDWFHQMASGSNEPPHACIEQVHSFPGQGVASSFSFGCNFGFLKACLTAAGIPFEEIAPRTWQKALGVSSKQKDEAKRTFKLRLKQQAQRLFPEHPVNSATCDALLLALYCRRKLTGTLAR